MRVTLDFNSPVLRRSKLFAEVARLAIEASVLVNRAHLRVFPNTPKMYESGVRYRLEPPGVEDFNDIETIIDRGWGDCAQLSAWRIAELREAGEGGEFRIAWKEPEDWDETFEGPRMFHVLIRRRDGRLEDPSVRLGMRSGDGVTPDQSPLVGYKRKDRR